MAHRTNETITHTKAAPMTASVAHRRGIIHAVDRHKTRERRRVRRQEDRAWRTEALEMLEATTA